MINTPALQITHYTESNHFLLLRATLQIKRLKIYFSALEPSYCATLGKSHFHLLPLEIRSLNEEFYEDFINAVTLPDEIK